MIPRIYCPPIPEENSAIELADDTVRYLRNVLRLGPGDEVLFFDGTGWEYRGVIDRFEDRGGAVRIVARQRIPHRDPRAHHAGPGPPEGRQDGVHRPEGHGAGRGPDHPLPLLPDHPETDGGASRQRGSSAGAGSPPRRPSSAGGAMSPRSAETLPFTEALGAAGPGP